MDADEALFLLCQERNLELAVVRGPSRKAEHVRMRRQLAMELATAFNQSEIARAMKKHPSSVWALIRGGKGKQACVDRHVEKESE